MLGNRIRKLRTARGLTQVELAEKMGVTQPYIAQLESGVRKNPSLMFLRRLAKLLKVDLSEIIQ